MRMFGLAIRHFIRGPANTDINTDAQCWISRPLLDIMASLNGPEYSLKFPDALPLPVGTLVKPVTMVRVSFSSSTVQQPGLRGFGTKFLPIVSESHAGGSMLCRIWTPGCSSIEISSVEGVLEEVVVQGRQIDQWRSRVSFALLEANYNIFGRHVDR